MIFETGAPWTTVNADGYSNIVNSYGNLNYPITPQGQKDFLLDLAKTVYNAGGTGVLYWEPAWISSQMCDLWGKGSSYENMSFFNFNNNNSPLPAFDFFNFCNSLSLPSKIIDNDKNIIYPNPTKNVIKIIGLNNSTEIRIIDNLGSTVKKILSDKNTIDISDLPIGVYYISLLIDNNVVSKKIIKE